MRKLLVAFFVFASASSFVRAADDYQPGPDSKAQDAVPQGEVIKGVFE